MTNNNNSKQYLSLASPTSMRPRPSPRYANGTCATDEDYWEVFQKVCDLGPDEINKLHALDYSSMTRLSVIGLHKNVQCLVDAGISHAKAHMVLLFCTYLLHCKYHKHNISKELSFEHVLEFNFLLDNPQQLNVTEPVPMPKVVQPKINKYQSAPTVTPTGSVVSDLDLDISFQSQNSMGSSQASSKKRGKNGNKNNTRRQRPRKCDNRGLGSSEHSAMSAASKSSMRSNVSTASKKSVTWNPKLNHVNNVSFSKFSSIDEKATSTLAADTPSTDLLISRWSSSTPSPPTEERVPLRPTLSRMPSLGRRSFMSMESVDNSVRRPYRRPSLEKDTAEKLQMCDFNAEMDGSGHNTAFYSMAVSLPLTTTTETTEGDLHETETARARNDTAPPALGPDTPPPRCSIERSSLRWAQALDVDEDLTDSDWSDSESGDDSEWGSDDDEDNSSDDEEEETEMEQSPVKELVQRDQQGLVSKTVLSWTSQNVTIEEWTLPSNQILPVNIQELIRQAAENPELNIQDQIHQALSRSLVRPGGLDNEFTLATAADK